MAGVTLREVLEGYRRFNAWEREEQKNALPGLSVEESLRRYFELCDLAHALAPDAAQLNQLKAQHQIYEGPLPRPATRGPSAGGDAVWGVVEAGV